MPRGTENNENENNSNRRYSQAPPPLVAFNLNNPPPPPEGFVNTTKNWLNMQPSFIKASELHESNRGVTLAELTKNNDN